MQAPIDSTLVIVPARTATIPQKASVETRHQLHAIEEVDSHDTGRVAFHQYKTFLKSQQDLVDTQTHRIGTVLFSAERTAATAAESIRATVIIIIVEFHITRTITG